MTQFFEQTLVKNLTIIPITPKYGIQRSAYFAAPYFTHRIVLAKKFSPALPFSYMPRNGGYAETLVEMTAAFFAGHPCPAYYKYANIVKFNAWRY